MKIKILIVALASIFALRAMDESDSYFNSWQAYWQNELDNAAAHFEKGHFAKARQGYEHLATSGNPNITQAVRQAAGDRLQDMNRRQIPDIDFLSSGERRIKEAQSREGDRLLRRLNVADAKRAAGKYAQAARIYEQLANAPAPYHVYQSWGSMRLKEMRDVGQLTE